MNKYFLLLLGWLIPFFIVAEDNDSIRLNVALDEIIVQSFKQDKSFRNTPVSASAIPLTTITNRNITDIKELSSVIPNLFMPDYGSKLTSPIYIRGIGSKINSPSVGLYVDGVPYFDKSASDFDFSEIDRIEVLRGPQGTLYGRNTMGGIINVYTKSPFKYEGTNLNFSGGSYATLDAAASHYGNINQTFGYSVSGNYKHTDGYFTNAFTGKKADALNSGAGRIRLSWRVTPRLDMHLTSSYDYSDQGGYPYALLDPKNNTVGQVDYDSYSYYKRSIATTGYTVEYHNDVYRLSSQTAYQHFTDHQGIDQDFSPKDLYFVTQDQVQNMLSEEFNIKSMKQQSYKWIFGAFGFYQGLDNTVDLNFKPQAMSTVKTYSTPTFGGALYHQSTVDNLLVKNLTLTLGIRYDIERAGTTFDSDTIKNNVIKPGEAFKSRKTFSQITPKASLQYSIAGQQMIYATVTRGYKAGGFNTSFDTEKERSFAPEYSWNYEAGTKLSFLNRRLTTELSLFFIDWRDQQITQTVASGKGSLLKNAGRSQSKGVEVSIQANPFKEFNMQVNYGYTHATFKEYKRAANLDYSGNYLPLVPSHTLSVSGDYTIHANSQWLEKIILSAQYTGTGRLYWNENNKVSQPYYGVLNARAAFSKGPLTVALWAKNITNTTYIAYLFESMGNSFAQTGKPATFGANIMLNF